MDEGIKSRLIIHKILKQIRIKSKNFDEVFDFETSKEVLGSQNKKFIYNATLTTLRKNLIIKKIIKDLVKKINDDSDSYFLLLSALSQMLFLNIKDYAVVNSTVELSKNKIINSNTGFINGCLRNFIRKKDFYKKKELQFESLPKWFLNKTDNFKKNDKINFISNIIEQPSLHIVFKKNVDQIKYKEIGKRTSENSTAINNNITFEEIPYYRKGEWWVQDYSSMLPLSITDISKFNNIADVGSAPGGKLFQITNKTNNVTPYEKNKIRSKILKINLKRLKIKVDVKIEDFLNIKLDKKFDLIVLDAPCSSVGTIRRNPEIFFKNESPNFNYLIKQQYDLLKKSSKHLNKNGVIIYMVCSFLEEETTNQINKFLLHNSDFAIEKFEKDKKKLSDKFINEDGNILITPNTILNDIKIDGYFASKLIKK